MLWSATCQLSELNALDASTRMTASVSGDSDIWRIALYTATLPDAAFGLYLTGTY